MNSLRALLICLAIFVKEGLASTVCVGEYTSFTCFFSDCCTDGIFIYCCFSNGAGFGIIFGGLAFFLGLLGFFCRRRRLMMRAQAANLGAPVAATNTGVNSRGYAAYPQAGSYPQGPK